MTSLGDDDANDNPKEGDSTVDLSDTETQAFDSQFPPQLLSGGEFTDEDIDELQSLHGTVLFDDTLPLEDDFETQLVNLGGETQLLNLGGESQAVNLGDETQVVNLGGETQVLDYLDCVENNETQLLNDCDTEVVDTDDEGSVRTQVLCDTEEVSDDSSLKNVGGKIQTAPRALSNEDCSSGFAPRGFTSLRAASVRAAGLAARNSVSKGTTSGSCSTTSVSQSLKQPITNEDTTPVTRDLSRLTEEVDHGNTTGEYGEQMKGISNKNKCRAGRSAVRKLFTEDDDKLDETKGVVEEAENGLAGLSYIDSQEPGEESQANALDFVDRFLKVNVEEVDQGVDLGKSIRGTAKLASSAKGAQILAKSVNLLSSGGKSCAFDFDDSHEDEGGGEFIRKKKEVIFGNQQGRSSKLKRKGDNGSKKSTEAKLAKNLINEFNEEFNTSPNDGVVEVEVGPDTQMAADAMEALCSGLGGGPPVDNYDANQGLKSAQNGSHKKERKKKVSSNSGVVTRQSKQTKKTATNLSKEASKLSPKSSMKDKKKLKIGKSTKANENLSERKVGKSQILKINDIDENITCQVTISTPVKKRRIQGQHGNFTPVARRTRQSMGENLAKSCGDALGDLREWNSMTGSGDCKGKRKCSAAVDALAKEKSSDVNTLQHEESDPNLSGTTNAVGVDLPEYPKRTRTTRERPQEANGQSTPRSKRSKTDTINVSVDVVIKRSTRSSVNLKSVNKKGCAIANDVEVSPRKPCDSACTTPVNCVTPVNEASPICMGDEYLKKSCRKKLTKLALVKELNSLISTEKESDSPSKDLRRRREMASVKVLFSRHLDGEIIKHQKKILTRLGASVVSSMSGATHFIADEFVRTRNMLEAIAFGKPVVTHLWLESCGQANCLIDERNYILRDAKKEKEFGFSLPVSLARASKHPVLKGQKVFITPNTKPSREIVASLVKAVHGSAVERIGRSALKDDKIPDNILVLSCEEDYEVCVPYLEKGAEVYSSELLLDGIVTQKLDYERHRLFLDHVKKTRSTIWLRKEINQFKPVARCK